MPTPIDFMGVQPSSNGGGTVGPKMNAPLFLDATYGIVFVDQADGTFWSLVMIAGVLTPQQITL